jgi:hypothetical protein
MDFIKWIGAGMIAGLFGAFVWAGISYGTNYEVGYIAWGIGAIVGFAVRAVAGNDKEGFAPGATAVAVAIGAVLLGKFLAAHFSVNKEVAELQVPVFTAENAQMRIAREIAEERISKGQNIVFAAGKTLDDVESPTDMPPALWQEATSKWNAIPADEQKRQIDETNDGLKKLVGMLAGKARSERFANSFSPFDLLWAFLAAGTAYRLGAGNASDD